MTVILGLLILLVGMSISRIVSEYRSDYQPIASLFEAERSSGFNAIYRILTAPVVIVLSSITFYLIGKESLIENMWIAAVWYFIFQLTLLFTLQRWSLVNKSKFILFHAISIALSYYLYVSLLTGGIDKLLPDEANLRTDIWLVIIAFFYGIFKNVQENNKTFVKRKESYIAERAHKFRTKYQDTLKKYDLRFQNILLAIMIYEDFNRPKIVRYYEKMTHAKTQGIMQTNDTKTDTESIEKTIKSIEILYKNLPRIDADKLYEYEEALMNLFKIHNPHDLNYTYEVKTIFDELQSM
jgi:hypothetical protein